MASPDPSPRNDFFKQIKPICVPLSRLALSSASKAASAKEIQDFISKLTKIWNEQALKDSAVLDEKLADYVFFPLSHVLRLQEQYPVRVVESIITLLRSLIHSGWKRKITKDLTLQLLIFLTLTIEKSSGPEKSRTVPEETVLEGYRTLSVLLTTLGVSQAASSLLTEDSSVKAVGHAIAVILDGITDGASSEIQLEALQCLNAVFTSVKNQDVLARYMPGTVSSLSKLLSPPLQLRTQKRVLVVSLETLKLVLITVLGDLRTRGLLKKTDNLELDHCTRPEVGKIDQESQQNLTPAWLTVTTAQVKIALASVLKLRNRGSDDVRQALYRVCIGLLDECHSSLALCRPILVESAMMTETQEIVDSRLETSLQDLAGVYPELEEIIKSTLFAWITGLPRVMQGSNEHVKQQAIRNLLKGSKLAEALRLDSSTLENSLGDSLRDSLVAMLRSSKQAKILEETDPDRDIWTNTDLLPLNSISSRLASRGYLPVLLAQESQKQIRTELLSLISGLGSSVLQTKLATDMLGYVRDSDGLDQVVAYWLSFELLKANYNNSSDFDGFFDLGSLSETEQQNMIFRELFNFSASLLSLHSDAVDVDWRLEAIALEVTAYAASQTKSDFRPELIDVLYPITTFLGSQNPQLRSHAITTLNSVALSCGYLNVSDLIVDNADYMINSVSLRLNTFEISPASIKVLIVLIRLTGPKLIPYLDDVVAAIFAALDNYHGYPTFVESLFAVLYEVVQQGAKSETLLVENGASKAFAHTKQSPRAATMEDIIDLVDKRQQRTERNQLEEGTAADVLEGHPGKPWGPGKEKPKSFLETLEGMEERDRPSEDDFEPPPSAVAEPTKAPSTPTYTLLLRIASLTQHYLTSPTPTLRKSLLELVSVVSQALAPDDEAFLPLVNAIWPVVFARLRDPEPFIAVAACHALVSLCSAAGDFLHTRFKTEWWDGLGKWFARVKSEAAKVSGRASRTQPNATGDLSGEVLIPGGLTSDEAPAADMVRTKVSVLKPATTSVAGLGRFAQPAQIWDAAVALLTAIVCHVKVDDDMFDEILALLADEIPRRDSSVREALESINADAVWIARFERGLIVWETPPMPVMDGVMFAPMPAVRVTAR